MIVSVVVGRSSQQKTTSNHYSLGIDGPTAAIFFLKGEITAGWDIEMSHHLTMKSCFNSKIMPNEQACRLQIGE